MMDHITDEKLMELIKGNKGGFADNQFRELRALRYSEDGSKRFNRFLDLQELVEMGKELLSLPEMEPEEKVSSWRENIVNEETARSRSGRSGKSHHPSRAGSVISQIGGEQGKMEVRVGNLSVSFAPKAETEDRLMDLLERVANKSSRQASPERGGKSQREETPNPNRVKDLLNIALGGALIGATEVMKNSTPKTAQDFPLSSTIRPEYNEADQEKKIISHQDPKEVQRVPELIKQGRDRTFDSQTQHVTIRPMAYKLIKDRAIKFGGNKEENPLMFLEELDELRDSYDLTDREIFSNILLLLEDKAKRWYMVNRKQIHNLVEFLAMFKKEYANERVQEEVRRDLENTYQAEGEKLWDFISRCRVILDRRSPQLIESEQIYECYKRTKPHYQWYIKRKDLKSWDNFRSEGEDFELAKARQPD